MIPAGVSASCAPNAPPSYDDITYVKITQYALVGQAYPWYTYESILYRPARPSQERADVSLVARHATKFAGTFVAVDPIRVFSNIVGVLKRDRFFDMRLNPAKVLYLDGPEDEITVALCGIDWTLGTTPRGAEVDLSDAQGQAFFALESDLRDSIFANGQWTTHPPPPP